MKCATRETLQRLVHDQAGYTGCGNMLHRHLNRIYGNMALSLGSL